MTDSKLLREKIEESGLKITHIAKMVGLTYHGLLNKIDNRSEFRATEIKGLSDILHLTEEDRIAIFFAD